MHATQIETEEFVLREKRLGRRVVGVTRHDEPMQRPTVADAGGADLLGEDVEKWLLLHRRHPKRPLRTVVAEARPLPARHGEERDAPGAQRRLARRLRAGPSRGIASVLRPLFVGRRRETIEVDARGGVGGKQRACEPCDLAEIDFGRFLEQSVLRLGRKLVEEREDLSLAGALKFFDERMRHVR